MNFYEITGIVITLVSVAGTLGGLFYLINDARNDSRRKF